MIFNVRRLVTRRHCHKNNTVLTVFKFTRHFTAIVASQSLHVNKWLFRVILRKSEQFRSLKSAIVDLCVPNTQSVPLHPLSSPEASFADKQSSVASGRNGMASSKVHHGRNRLHKSEACQCSAGRRTLGHCPSISSIEQVLFDPLPFEFKPSREGLKGHSLAFVPS